MKSKWKEFLADAGAVMSGDTIEHFGNPRRELEVAFSGTVFADLEYMGVIAAHGPDAGAFLQSQLGNDIHDLDEHSSQLSSYCTPKGRMLGLMRIFRQDDTWYLRLPADSLEAVLQRLRMFVMRANVTLEDVSGNFLRMGVSGEDAPEEVRTAAGDCPGQVNGVVRSGKLTVLRVPGVRPRYEVFASSLQGAMDFWDAMNVRGAPVGEPAWRLLEIESGLPTVFASTAELFVPQMANLQLLHGISFKKGCYPGQEIVARMQYLGTLKRRMYLGLIQQDTVASPGDALFSASDDSQPVGLVVDSQPHPDGGQLALAILQIQSAEADDVFLGSSTGPAFTRQSLPYAFEAT